MTESSHVYVIGPQNGAKKIGIARNPMLRLAQLQTSSPFRLSQHFLSACKQSEARAIERRTHDILAAQRQAGEWFDVDSETAVAAVLRAAQELGYVLTRPIFHEPTPRPLAKDAVIQIRVKPEVKAAAQRLADQDGITVTALVTQLLMREIAARP